MIGFYIQINIFPREAKIAIVAKTETLNFSIKEVDNVEISAAWRGNGADVSSTGPSSERGWWVVGNIVKWTYE